MAHHAMTRRAPLTPSRAYAIAIQTGYPCGNRPLTVLVQVKAHVSDAVGPRAWIGGKKQIPRRLRHTGCETVEGHERTTLRDLHSFAHIDARIPSADLLYSAGGTAKVHPNAERN